MAARRSPEEMFPDLFGKPAVPAPPVELGPKDLRLLQWSMQRANHRPPSLRQAENERREARRPTSPERRHLPGALR